MFNLSAKWQMIKWRSITTLRITVSASTSETQGLTYTEAMAAGTPLVVEGNDYLNTLIDDPSLGITYESDRDFAAFIDYYERNIPAIPKFLLGRCMRFRHYVLVSRCYLSIMIWSP